MRHLAELNIAKLLYPFDDPRIADFANNLDRVNALAERSPGFVWRLVLGPREFAASARMWDQSTIPNISVWESPEALEHFTWNTVHKAFYRRRAEWFEALGSHHLVMWWVEPGHVPTLGEAKARLDHLDRHGDTDHAFGWSHLPHVKLWQSQRCA